MQAVQALSSLRYASPPVAAAGAGAATLIGGLLAYDPVIGIAALFALLYGALAMLNLPLAVGFWVPLFFLEGLPGTQILPEAGALAIVVAWAGQVGADHSWERLQLRLRGRIYFLLLVFLLWLALSMIWAEEPGEGMSLLVSTIEAATFFVLISTALSSTSHLRWVAIGFVTGAMISTLIGIAGFPGTEQGGRMQGASGDPNYFAAQVLAATAITAALAATTRHVIARFWLVVALVPFAYGLVASQSRGGFIAAVAMAVAALILFKRRRVQVLAATLALAALFSVWLAADPAALTRLTTNTDRGAGREDLWTVGWRVAADQPVEGVGLNNFGVVSRSYTREPGTLADVKQIERGQPVHNAYLSFLAETGIIGLALYLALAVVAVRAGARAASRFDLTGDGAAATLTRAIVVALVGMMSAAFFLPNGGDKRIFALMALAVAALAVAERVRVRPRPTAF
jgi:O-antigen ligase